MKNELRCELLTGKGGKLYELIDLRREHNGSTTAILKSADKYIVADEFKFVGNEISWLYATTHPTLDQAIKDFSSSADLRKSEELVSDGLIKPMRKHRGR